MELGVCVVGVKGIRERGTLCEWKGSHEAPVLNSFPRPTTISSVPGRGGQEEKMRDSKERLRTLSGIECKVTSV